MMLLQADYLPGKGTYVKGKDIVSSLLGVARINVAQRGTQDQVGED